MLPAAPYTNASSRKPPLLLTSTKRLAQVQYYWCVQSLWYLSRMFSFALCCYRSAFVALPFNHRAAVQYFCVCARERLSYLNPALYKNDTPHDFGFACILWSRQASVWRRLQAVISFLQEALRHDRLRNQHASSSRHLCVHSRCFTSTGLVSVQNSFGFC